MGIKLRKAVDTIAYRYIILRRRPCKLKTEKITKNNTHGWVHHAGHCSDMSVNR